MFSTLSHVLIFEVALQLCRRGIPALTVHDEIIVPRKDEGEAREVMYSTSYRQEALQSPVLKASEL
jgi:hypothetical protein